MDGGAGDDALLGGTGYDVLTGGDGSDYLAGGTESDRYVFGAVLSGADEMDTVAELAAEGADRLDFSGLAADDGVTVDLTRDDRLAAHRRRTVRTAAPGQAAWFEKATGGAGDDRLTGNAAANGLWGGGGNDVLDGGSGNDALYGEGGDDALFGAGGDDVLDGGVGFDTLDGGPGWDRGLNGEVLWNIEW
jgi:Ca2+-binding RTX toxin-like protein